MKIKNVRKIIKKNKKNIAGVALLGLSLILTSCETKQDRIDELERENHNLQFEYQRLQEDYDELSSYFTIDTERNCYYRNELMAVVTNDKEGTPEYRFVEENFIDVNFSAGVNLETAESVYVSITTPGLTYPNLEYRHTYVSNRNYYKYNTVQVSERTKNCTVYGGWIPDYEVEQYVISDINNLPIPKGYKDQTKFTVEELRDIEEQMNNRLIDATEQAKQQKFELNKLGYVLTDENTGFIVDKSAYLKILETTNPLDIYSFQENYYFYSITNPIRGLKVDINESVIFDDEDKKYPNANTILKVASIDPNDEMLCSVQDVLPISNFIGWDAYEEYQEKETLTYVEVLEIEQEINRTLAEKNVKTLKK